MKKNQHLIWLILIWLISSCTQLENSTKLPSQDVATPTKTSLKIDSFKFQFGIRSLLHDSQGNYWIGGHREGVCKFDGKTFTYFTAEDGLSSNQVRTIQEDKHGNIWFGTSNGISYFDGKQIKHLHKDDFGFKNEWDLSPNDLCIGDGNTVVVISAKEQKAYHLNLPDEAKEMSLNYSGSTGISKGKNGRLWIAFYSGVIGYEDQKFIQINNSSLGFDEASKFLHVRSILEDSQGRLWIGNNGIGVLERENNAIIHLSEVLGLIDKYGIENQITSPPGTLKHVFAIREDKHGNIWFGDRDTGAWKYDGKEMTNYTIDPKLKNQMIWDIYEDRNGNLLFAMADQGIYQFDGEFFFRKF